MKKTENEIIEMIESYLKLESNIKEIDNLICPPYVSKPIAATLEDFEKYQNQKNEYDNVVDLKGNQKKKLEKQLQELKFELIKSLPQSNVWFLLDNKKIAIGHRSDDWPSSLGDLLIVKEPIIEDLKEIHHQIVN